LLGAYTLNKRRISGTIVRKAGREIRETAPVRRRRRLAYAAGIIAVLVLITTTVILLRPEMISGFGKNKTATATQQDDSEYGGVQPAIDREGSENEGSDPARTESRNPADSRNSSGIPNSAPGMAGEVSAFPAAKHTSDEAPVESISAASLQDVRFKEILDDPSLDNSLASSFNSLFSRWNLPVRIEPSDTGCSTARAYDFKCLFLTGDWMKIRRLDVPVILSLKLSDERICNVALVGLRGNIATLEIGDKTFPFPLQVVDRMWDGSFILIWKPPFDALRLPMGMRGEEITWIRRTLDAYEGRPVSTAPSDLFDDDLRKRIVDFQKTQMLIQDGRVGPETLVRLSIALDKLNVPMLSRYSEEGRPL